MVQRVTRKIGDYELILETGKIGKQANGCAFMHYGDTVVLCTATASEKP